MFDKQLRFILSAVDKATWPIKWVGKSLGWLNNWLKSMKPAFQNMATYGAAATTAVASLGTAAVMQASKMQDLRIELNTLAWSAEKWLDLFKQIQKDAAKTPFESADLVQATSTMLQFGIAQDKVRKSMMMLGDISWGNAQKLQSLALVFGQINANGKLMWQDLLQLVNLWFNPLKEISEKTGESMESLREKMSNGQISFEMVEESMRRATSEWGLFFGMMEAKSQTFSGVMSTLRDNVGIALAALGWFSNGEVVEWWLLDTLTKAVNKLTPYLIKISERAASNPEMAKNIFLVVAAITVLITTIWLLGVAIPPLMTWLWILTGWLTAVKFAFIAVWWPITILIALLATLAVMTVKNWDEIKQWFKDWTEALWIYMDVLNTKSETHWMKMKQWASEWTGALYRYWEALKTNLDTVMMNIQNWLSSAWSAIVETAKSYISPLIDWLQAKFDAVVWFVNKIKAAIDSAKSFVTWEQSAPSPLIAWARALWWTVSANKSYLVWERWPEIFTPSTTWKINNNPWWSSQVVINMWWVTVNNEADENRLVQKIKEAFIRDTQLYNYWVS